MEHADTSGELRRLIEEGKKVIITTVQKFPRIVDDISSGHQDKSFAIIIDEAHSSQGGKTATAMNTALGGGGEQLEDEDDYEDEVNRVIDSRRMLTNASYFAFTATPKNRTLELFGLPDPQPDGAVRHLPFHSYTMKQAIDEGFIMDVLANYTPIQSYYNIIKKTEEDPEFDAKRAQRKLRRYVENHEYAIDTKAEIILDHFQESLWLTNKMDGQARAMLVTDGVDRAVSYYHAIRKLIAQRGYPYKALVAFSGSRDFNGEEVSEAKLNGFPNPGPRMNSRRTRTASSSAPTSSRRVTTSPCSTPCTWTRPYRASRPYRLSPGSTGTNRRKARPSCWTL